MGEIGSGNALAAPAGSPTTSLGSNLPGRPLPSTPPLIGELPALPDNLASPSEVSPTASGTTLAGLGPAPTNSEIGVARRFLYQFRIGGRAVFDDNIFLSRSLKESDEFFVLSAGVTLGLGDPNGGGNSLRFEYSPDASFYVSHGENDALQHSISLAGLYQFTKLTVSGRFQIQLLDGTGINSTVASGAQATQTNLDVSGRTKLNVYTGQANFNYAFSEKTSADLAAQYAISDYETLLSSQNFSASTFFNYTFSPKLTLGMGATLGETFSQQPNPNQTYYQFSLRTSYEATGKISVGGTFGLEVRTTDASSELQVGPVFSLNAVYLPFDGTSLSLLATRQVSPSAVQGGQTYTSTDLSVSLRQRFFQRFFTTLTVGYQNLSYTSTVTGASANREDNYYFVQPGVNFVVHENINLGIGFLHRQSQSTTTVGGFSDNQAYLSVAYQF